MSTRITRLSDDILQNIVANLPARSFSYAACVNRNWNAVCCRFLSRPLLSSATSLNPSLQGAIKEVIDKVLGGPIRPHFAIFCVSPAVNLDNAHGLLMKKLGSTVPIITCVAGGIIGRDAITNEFNEVQFPFDDDDNTHPANFTGISLTVGYVPGLKVDAIPLSRLEQGPAINEFVMDIRDYSTSVSGNPSPEAIIMFGDPKEDMKPVLEKMDYALSEQCVIAGNESCRFRHSSTDNSRFLACVRGQGQQFGVVALVFARDRTTAGGASKIEFHFAAGAGVSAIGPLYRVVSAKMRKDGFTTWLTAKREGENEILDGQQLLNDFDEEIGDPILNCDLYIGVKKKRKQSFGSERVKSVTSLSYHSVQEGDEQYLYVQGLDIKTGDLFRFYVPDLKYAVQQCSNVSENFRWLRHKDVIGGFAFACCGRGSTFFDEPNVDSSPILEHFPGVPLAGMFCGAEVGRGPPFVSPSDAGQECSSERCCLHVYSSIYVLMSWSVSG